MNGWVMPPLARAWFDWAWDYFAVLIAAQVALLIVMLFIGCPAQAQGLDPSMPVYSSTRQPAPERSHEQQRSYSRVKRTKRHEHRKGLKVRREEQYAPLIARYARRHGVPVQLALIITKIESSFNPRARSRKSKSYRSRGLMQLWLPTARKLGYRGRISGLFDPHVNVRWGMKELASCYRKARGNWRRTGHCYNGGPARTYARRLPRETRNYGRLIVMHRKAGSYRRWGA